MANPPHVTENSSAPSLTTAATTTACLPSFAKVAPHRAVPLGRHAMHLMHCTRSPSYITISPFNTPSSQLTFSPIHFTAYIYIDISIANLCVHILLLQFDRKLVKLSYGGHDDVHFCYARRLASSPGADPAVQESRSREQSTVEVGAEGASAVRFG